ncbi:MAG: trimeric intracellular cation channel family protein [Ectothiorhodospiraceae bacterium]|nr:trimeric intracellular cation channel family protein [Ectothiorhodospiraceae bacterium]MCH8503688.1 trimeric intracellular cation channel family protein [Ectothiorhodospiraceae bacterium]
MIYWLDLFGTAVFAVSGALAAGRKNLDLFGVLVLAVVTAIGGGTLRDLTLGATPVFWVTDPVYLWLASAAGLVTIYLARHDFLQRRFLPIADALGLATFCVIGAERALSLGVNPSIAVLMGVMTGVFGGMIRDVLCGEVPLVLRRELYATAALLGATVTVVLALVLPGIALATWAGLLSALALRLAAIRWNLSLPVFVHHSRH